MQKEYYLFRLTLPPTIYRLNTMKNKSYIVKVYEVHTIEIPIEATSVEKAFEKVKKSIAKGSIDHSNMEYNYTLDSDEWSISDAKTGEKLY